MTYPNDDSFATLAYHWEISRMCMCMQADNQLKVSLLWIWTAFLSHIIASGFRKMQTADRDFTHLPILQIDAVKCFAMTNIKIWARELN